MLLANIHSSNILQVAVIINKTQKHLTTFQSYHISRMELRIKNMSKSHKTFYTVILYPNDTKILIQVLNRQTKSELQL